MHVAFARVVKSPFAAHLAGFVHGVPVLRRSDPIAAALASPRLI
jgi:hypothetical protein